MKNSNENIKAKFQDLVSSGIVKGKIIGPLDNVLSCETMNDWVIAGSEFSKSGYCVSSPGSYGTHPTSRQNTHNKIWKSGTICACVIDRKILCFSLPQTACDYCNIIK